MKKITNIYVREGKKHADIIVIHPITGERLVMAFYKSKRWHSFLKEYFEIESGVDDADIDRDEGA